MRFVVLPVRFYLCAVVVALLVIAGSGRPCLAITAGYIDTFNDSNLRGWRIGHESTFPQLALHNGQNGTGDHSLRMETAGAAGDQPRLLVMNDAQLNDGNWEGNWTAAGVTRISMDVKNPNAWDLHMRLGIAGAGNFFQGGGGDTFVTDAIVVAPNPNGWQHIEFSVQAANWHSYGGYVEPPATVPSAALALANVTHFRILHNPMESFLGADTTAALGDYNINDLVDAADYVAWRQNPTFLFNEGASPDIVDEADYTFWRSRFGGKGGGIFFLDNIQAIGTSVAAGGGGGLVAAMAPEPASWLLMVGLSACVWNLVRRR